MKNLSILGIITAVLLLPLLSACQSDNVVTPTPLPSGSLPSSTGTEAPDDLINTPGGTGYRAGFQLEREEHHWPPIEIATVVLGTGSDILNIRYRAYIESKAGETRNNIISVTKDGGLVGSRLVLYTNTAPDGMKLTILNGNGLWGSLAAVLAIEISLEVSPGQYVFRIGIKVDGKDFGTLPCTINIIK